MQETGRYDGMLIPVDAQNAPPRSTFPPPLVFFALLAVVVALFFVRSGGPASVDKPFTFLAIALPVIAAGLYVLRRALAPTVRRLGANAVISIANWTQRNASRSQAYASPEYRPPVKQRLLTPALAFSAGILATLAIKHLDLTRLSMSGLGSRLNAFSFISSPSLTDATAVPRAVVEQPDVTDTKVNSGITRLVTVEPRSPLGRSSVGIMREDALMFADRYLRGVTGLSRHRLEAAYWLKHALSATLKDPSLTWALTQLGSVLAAPEAGLPDYRGASTVWQVSASLGDPIAYCFLARMHEHGLGVEKDPDTARRLYSHALSSGGCPGLMQSLSRLQ